jgi:hypothetical protein
MKADPACVGQAGGGGTSAANETAVIIESASAETKLRDKIMEMLSFFDVPGAPLFYLKRRI